MSFHAKDLQIDLLQLQTRRCSPKSAHVLLLLNLAFGLPINNRISNFLKLVSSNQLNNRRSAFQHLIFFVPYLCFRQNVNAIKINTLQTPLKVFLVPKEYFCKISHPTDKHTKMHIQLIVLAWQMNSVKEKKNIQWDGHKTEECKFLTQDIRKSLKTFCGKNTICRIQFAKVFTPLRQKSFN